MESLRASAARHLIKADDVEKRSGTETDAISPAAAERSDIASCCWKAQGSRGEQEMRATERLDEQELVQRCCRPLLGLSGHGTGKNIQCGGKQDQYLLRSRNLMRSTRIRARIIPRRFCVPRAPWWGKHLMRGRDFDSAPREIISRTRRCGPSRSSRGRGSVHGLAFLSRHESWRGTCADCGHSQTYCVEAGDW